MEVCCVWARLFLIYKGQVKKLNLTKSAKKFEISDNFDCQKMLSLQPRIHSPNRMHRNDAGAMTNCFMWFETDSELSIAKN